MRKNEISLGSNTKEYISQIFQKYVPDLYKIAKMRLYNEDDIYDVIQETGYKFYVNINKIRDTDKIKTWLIRVLINECNKIYRSKKRHMRLQEKIIQESFNDTDFNQETNLNFEMLINGLKKEDRIILTLYYGNNLTTKEISKILKKNENTIRTRIKRAKEFIKLNINEEES